MVLICVMFVILLYFGFVFLGLLVIVGWKRLGSYWLGLAECLWFNCCGIFRLVVSSFIVYLLCGFRCSHLFCLMCGFCLLGVAALGLWLWLVWVWILFLWLFRFVDCWGGLFLIVLFYLWCCIPFVWWLIIGLVGLLLLVVLCLLLCFLAYWYYSCVVLFGLIIGVFLLLFVVLTWNLW